MYDPRLPCVNMEHVGMYDVVFAEESLVLVRQHVRKVEGDEVIMVMPSLNGSRGWTVTVVLPHDQVV